VKGNANFKEMERKNQQKEEGVVKKATPLLGGKEKEFF